MYLTRAPIDVTGLVDLVCGPGRGGTNMFIGTVRRSPDDGPVEAIEYSAYDEMAGAEFQRILAEAAERWPEARVEVRHRLGRIPTGDASIAVVCAAPHRAEAFDACRYVVEQTKHRVPIWKHEILAGGAKRWRANDPSEEVV